MLTTSNYIHFWLPRHTPRTSKVPNLDCQKMDLFRVIEISFVELTKICIVDAHCSIADELGSSVFLHNRDYDVDNLFDTNCSIYLVVFKCEHKHFVEGFRYKIESN